MHQENNDNTGAAADPATAGSGQTGSAAEDTEKLPPVRALFVGMIRLYQRGISPLLPPACRFHPSCSEYTRQAIVRHGIFKGIGLGVVRLSKCHPFHPGGYDPVP